MHRVWATRQIPGQAISRLSEIANVEVWPSRMPPSRDELIAGVKACDGILTLLSDRVDGEVMDAAGSQLRVISNFAVGVNNIDLAAARERGIRVGNTPDVLTDATADLAVALMLAAARHVRPAAEEVRVGQWKTWEPTGWLGLELSGKTIGIVGMGRIGAAVARRLVGGWGMKLLYTSRQPRKNIDGQHVDLDTLLRHSDFISLHVPLTETTRNLIDAPELAKMKSSAVLVNTARGEVIQQDALVDSLKRGQIFAAGLDVTTPEPLPADHPLIGLENVVIVPHIGSATTAARESMSRIAVDNLIAGLQGGELVHEVVEPPNSKA